MLMQTAADVGCIINAAVDRSRIARGDCMRVCNRVRGTVSVRLSVCLSLCVSVCVFESRYLRQRGCVFAPVVGWFVCLSAGLVKSGNSLKQEKLFEFWRRSGSTYKKIVYFFIFFNISKTYCKYAVSRIRVR